MYTQRSTTGELVGNCLERSREFGGNCWRIAGDLTGIVVRIQLEERESQRWYGLDPGYYFMGPLLWDRANVHRLLGIRNLFSADVS